MEKSTKPKSFFVADPSAANPAVLKLADGYHDEVAKVPETQPAVITPRLSEA